MGQKRDAIGITPTVVAKDAPNLLKGCAFWEVKLLPSIATAIAADRIVELQTTEPEEVLARLVAAIAASAGLADREEALRTAILAREELSSTAIDGGLALPHARLPGLKAFTIALGRSREGVAFGAQDGRPVHIFLMLAGPEGEERQPDYLKLLRSATGFLRAEKERLLGLEDLTMAYALCQEY